MNNNQIFTNLITCVKAALTANSISGWSVAQNYTPAQGNYPRPIILIHKLGTFTEGWQSRADKKDTDGILKHYETQQSYILFRLEALKNRDITKPEEDTAADVLDCVRAYFNGNEGIKLLRSYGLNPYRIENIEEPEYTTENDVFEFHPFFDFKVVIFKEYKKPQAAVTAAEIKTIKGV